MSGRIFRHTLVVHRAPLVDDGRGNEEHDWSQATETPIPGWAVDAGNTTADTTNRDGAMVEYTVRGPFTADVLASDRVGLLGGLYDVEGGVRRQPGPTPRTSHTILTLKKWTG